MTTDYFSQEYLSEKYDALAEKYTKRRAGFDNTAQLEELNRLIPAESRILDIGCGSGIPVARYFTDEGHRVTGFDLSPKMIELARKEVPGARFFTGDVLTVELEPGRCDLVVSFYCIFHIHAGEQKGVFADIHRWLKPGACTYFTLASSEYTGSERYDGTVEFDGIPMPYSHYSVAEYRRIFLELDFQVLSLDKLTIGGETMLWALLKKPSCK